MAAKYTSDMEELIREEITCPVCLEIFTEPQMLFCLHNFCLKCVKNVAGIHTTVICPTCRGPTAKKDIKNDFRITRLIQKYEKIVKEQEKDQPMLSNSHSCELCEEKPAMYKCQNCKRLTCLTCKTVHLKISICQEIDSVTLASLTKKDLDDLEAWKNKVETQATHEQTSYRKDMKKMEDQRQEALKSVDEQELDALKHFRSERQIIYKNVKKMEVEVPTEELEIIDKQEAAALQQFRKERQKIKANVNEYTKIRTTEHDKYQTKIKEITNYINTMEQADEKATSRSSESIIDELEKELGKLQSTTFSVIEMTINNKEFNEEKAIGVTITNDRRQQISSPITKLLTNNCNVLMREKLTIKLSVDLPGRVMKMLVFNGQLLCLLKDRIEVYNPTTGQHKRTLTTGLRLAWSMTITKTGELLIATQLEGLLHYNTGGGRIQCLNKEPHWDVATRGDGAVALSVKDTIVRNKKSRMINIAEYDSQLQIINRTPSPVREDGSVTCSLVGESLYICTGGQHCVHRVDVNTGRVSQTLGCRGDREPGHLNLPYICCTDGQVLVIADCYNHRVQALDCVSGEWRVLDIEGVLRPRAGVVDSEGRLLVAGDGPNTLYIIG